MTTWNPWHGCHRVGAGCASCTVFEKDRQYGRQTEQIRKTGKYLLPISHTKSGGHVLDAGQGPVYVCDSSDFFIEEADAWRGECWKMIRLRRDLEFRILTRRPERIAACLPEDWEDGYPNVLLAVSCEDQASCNARIPELLKIPAAKRGLCLSPLLEKVDLEPWLGGGSIDWVSCGGEVGSSTRLCDFSWIREIRLQCIRSGVSFEVSNLGSRFRKDGRVYRMDPDTQIEQSARSHLNYFPGSTEPSRISYTLPEREELFTRLERSAFRSRFHLNEEHRDYIQKLGEETLRQHASDFVSQRLSAENPTNDGRQTPMRGHPVFVAQHATACCCRGCIEKWHHIPAGKPLSPEEQDYLTGVLMDWIEKECKENSDEKQ